MSSAQESVISSEAGVASARLFGVPVGDFGLFASVLIPFAAGFLAFFLFSFFGIFGVWIYDGVKHLGMSNLAISYEWIGLPAGLLVLVVSFLYFVSLWVRRTLMGK